MTMKPFEIQSPALSINGVLIDTSAQGKLVIPGVTRAGTSVAIEVEDTGDQTYNFGSNADPATITVIDGYQFAVLNGDIQAQVGWTAATYAANEIDSEGFIDGISVVTGGAGYTGEVVTYSQQMLATEFADPLSSFDPGVWTWIPFKVRCGAGEIESEFGGGGATSIDQLSGIDVSDPQDGQALVWDSNDEVWKNQTISGGGSSGDRITSPNSDYEAAIDNNGTLGIANGTFLALNTTGGGYSTTVNGDGISMVWNGEQTGTIGKGPDGFSLNAASGKSIGVTTDGMSNNWEFTAAGELTFPDGSKQLTAYTGQTSGSGELYIMANVDGNVVTSTDGVNWGDPVSSGMGNIYRVEAHNGVIVYIGGGEGPGVPGLYYSTEIGTSTLCSGTDSIDQSPIYFSQVRYFTETNKWVAVGYIQGGTNNFPLLAHSDNGISWTIVPADNTFITGFNPSNYNWFLNDIVFLNETNQYVISSSIDNDSTFGGIFITQDVTVPLDGSVHVPINFNVGKVAPWSVVGFGGPAGYMMLFSESYGPETTEVWWGWGTNTIDYSTTAEYWAGSVTSQIGYLPQIAEVAYDTNDFIATTTTGQVITPAFSSGPYWQVSIPLPYTTTTFSISNTNPAVLAYSGIINGLTNNEKIIITDAGSYNGEYFWKESDGTLYTDQSLSSALDASGLSTFTTGTLTASHGQYFDAAGTSQSYYFVGNDDEQIFRSSNGVTWTLVADVDGQYFNDFAYGSWGSAPVSRLDYTDSETNYHSTAVLTYDFEVDVDNAHLTIRGDGSWDIGSSNFDTKIYSAGPETPTNIIVQANNKYWVFSDDGKLNFPDNTRQSTAYVHRNINLDGGGAMAHYDVEVDVAFVDGGFSSTRHGVADTSFDGGNRLTEANQYNLDGGGA